MLSYKHIHCSVHLFGENFFLIFNALWDWRFRRIYFAAKQLEVCLYLVVLGNKASPVNLPIAGFRLRIVFLLVWLWIHSE